MRSFALLLLAAFLPSAAFAVPARVILIRHGEKPESKRDPHLTEAGRAHAEHWAAYLTRESAPKPDALFAPKPSEKHPSVRASETLEPTARRLKLDIQTPDEAGDYARLAKTLLSDPRWDGKTVVVCWVHQYLPQFAVALGAKPAAEKWNDDDYDGVYEVTFRDGRASLATSRGATAR
jgi:broad specificity phosphatase PhoE